MTEQKKSMRGFATMKAKDPERLKDLAKEGGRAAQRAGGHKFTKEEAQEAGKKGGLISAELRRKKEFVGME